MPAYFINPSLFNSVNFEVIRIVSKNYKTQYYYLNVLPTVVNIFNSLFLCIFYCFRFWGKRKMTEWRKVQLTCDKSCSTSNYCCEGSTLVGKPTYILCIGELNNSRWRHYTIILSPNTMTSFSLISLVSCQYLFNHRVRLIKNITRKKYVL